MVKAIFFDVDGTLVSFKTHRVPDSTVKALITLKKQGIKLFVASGRHKLAINNLGSLEFDGYITLNGGICTVNNQLIDKHAIDKKDILSLTEYLRNDKKFPCVYVQQNNLIMNFTNAATDEIFKLLDFPEPPFGDLTTVEGDVYQVIAFFSKSEEEKIMKRLPNCDTTRWNPLFTDIVPKGSSKWIGICKVLEYYGVNQDETMAFGDGGNDMEMLKNAHIGIAMGNAEENVKKIADYSTSSVDDDGILNALKHYKLL